MTGTLHDVTSDATDAVVPAVTIELSGPALMGHRAIVTNGEGY